VWFSAGFTFEYHRDEEKTRDAHDGRGWSTLGDVGHLDDDGYLYLTDRQAFMIIAGGVNIYPREIEDVLVVHPLVADAAVIGVPNDDLGEEVKAVVQLLDPERAGPDMEAELLAFCRERLAAFKCPRSIDFDPNLPRQDTGKLYKRLLRDRYWGDRTSRIV
jgi:fatty-acyl-CoA synthase